MSQFFEPSKFYPSPKVREVIPKDHRGLVAWAAKNDVQVYRFDGKTVAFLGADLNRAIEASATRAPRAPGGIVAERLSQSGGTG